MTRIDGARMAKQERKTEFTYNHARRLFRAAQKTPEELFVTLKSSYKGLNKEEVEERLKLFGKNDLMENKGLFSLSLLIKTIRNPINYLICGLAVASYLVGNSRVSMLMGIVVATSILMTFIQETRFKRFVNRLLSMTQVNVTVIRDYETETSQADVTSSLDYVIPITELVPGDIVRISAGDIIPADIRLLSSKNLLVNQSVLTGETIPVDKDSQFDDALLKNLPDLKNVCFLGSSVVNGIGVGIVIHTGHEAYVSSLAKQLKPKNETSFDNGAHRFVLRTLRFMLVLAPVISIVSLITKGNWSDALLFAITLTVSLTPKSLPLTISGNLTRGALSMLKKRVVVKHLSAIQNLGAMDILCTDKTGTLTEDFSVCSGAFNTLDQADNKVMLYAYLNSFFQTGLKNHLDFALIKHAKLMKLNEEIKNYKYLDELPFDFTRKRISILVKNKDGSHLFICKGSLEEILPICSSASTSSYLSMVQKINELGQQAFAVAYKEVSREQNNCQLSDEENLTLLGYVAFLNPPLKKEIPELLKRLKQYGVGIKIMTGDNHWDTIKIAQEVGIKNAKVLLGNQIDALEDEELKVAAEKTSVFAKLSPDHKQRIINALQDNGHTVGYLGDGINDVPALFASDVGISVSNAVTTAKESSDIVLLKNSMSVLVDGIIEGRKAFINIDKYIKINSVTKFGASLSMLGASIFLPFLPLTPIQMLIQNLVFEFSQFGMPFDKIEEEQILKPSKWEFTELQKFRLSFGPILTLFDFITFALMWCYFKTTLPSSQSLFQSAWLLESIIAQALVLHLFHSKKISIFQFKSLKPSLVSTILALVIGIYIPFSPIAKALGFVPLPKIYFLWMIIIIVSYCIVTELLKFFFGKRYSLNI